MPENKPQIESAKSNHKPATPETTPFQLIGPPAPAKRGEDFGDLLLPGMTQFQLLTRKVKHSARLMQLISHCCNTVLPEALTQESRSAGALTPKQRTQLYTWLSQNAQMQLSILEKVSSRITVLTTDIFGHQAVMAMLDMQDSKDGRTTRTG